MIASRKNWYRVSTLDGSMSLWQADHCKDKEEAMQRIDRANKERENDGLTVEQYLIVYVEEIVHVADESFGTHAGCFQKKETIEYVVQAYPEIGTAKGGQA